MRKEEILEMEKKFVDLVRKPIKSQAEVMEMEGIRQELEKQLQLETKELLNDLQRAGLKITSVYDIVNTSQIYKEAILVLIEHLPQPYHLRNKEGIVRALAVKEAKGVACRTILDEYHKAPKDDFHYRWTFGNTMAVIITTEYIDDVIAIVQDESNGDSRQMFVAALGKIKSPTAKEVLGQLIKDESKVISKEAIKALKRQGKL